MPVSSPPPKALQSQGAEGGPLGGFRLGERDRLGDGTPAVGERARTGVGRAF